MVATHSPKAILLDLHLPDMDGCEVLKQIRQDSRYGNIPVLILTGFASDRRRNEAHCLGISGYINKTSDLQTLADHLILFKHLLQKAAPPSAGQHLSPNNLRGMFSLMARAQAYSIIETGGYMAVVVDNRDAQEMYGYLEARVETMKRRIKELESENEKLRQGVDSECSSLKCSV